MEFAQYYHQDDGPQAFDFSPYNFSSEPPMLPQQHYDSSPLGPLVTHSMQQNDDRDLSGQKEEEIDASSRPRLTTEQTNVLEEHFQRESKPITEVKKQLAVQVGLPLDKVNNWYQNRRAKAKHLKKQEILEVMHFHHNPVGLWTYGDMISPSFPPSAYHSSELMSTPIQTSMEQSDFTSYDSTPETSSPYELHNPRPCSAWPGIHQSAEAPQLAHQFSNNDVRIQALPSTDQRLQQFIINNVQSNEPDVPVSAFSEWGSSKAPSAAWTPGTQRDNPFEDKSLLLQQSGIPSFMQDLQEQSVPQPVTDIDPYTLYPNTVAIHNSHPISQPIPLPQQQINRQSPDGSPFISMHKHRVQTPTHQQILQQSPDGSPFIASQYHDTQENAHSRRGSDSSDLASNFDTIHLQRVSSQHSNGKGVFKTPSISSMNLAARRKKQRPAALGAVAMRSQSCAGPQNASPVPKCTTLSPSHSVRRIRSTGNSLNVMSGRIQKSGAGQRSPLNFQTFHEAGAFDSVDAFTAQSTDTSQASTGLNAGPLTPHTPSKFESQSQSWGKHPTHFEPNPAILQSQNFSHNTYDDSAQVKSPPGTPFTEMALYPQYQSQYAAPPLSAPPQLTSFPNISPPFNPAPAAASNLFIPQQSLPEAYGFYPMPQMQQQQQSFPVIHYSQSQPSFYACHPPQTVHSSSSMSGLHNFYSNPPQHKEMEFVIQTFDTPKEAQPPPPKEPHQQRDNRRSMDRFY